MTSFAQRIQHLPVLGIGVSTEYGAAEAPRALDIAAWREAHPAFAAFLEVGVEVVKGLDATAHSWIERGLPTTYHFLDINLDETEDFDASWLAAVQRLTAQLQPAWLCGDAGLWHFGRRERGHMLLLPPILSRESARQQAAGVVRLREAVGYEVFPENPPGQVFLGDLHVLDYYAAVAEYADTGVLLDCAHLAMYQQVMRHHPCTALEHFPLERIVELHVAGSTRRTHQGWSYWEDDHTPQVLEATWEIFAWVAARAPNLKAIVFECERNPQDTLLAGFQRIAATAAHSALAGIVPAKATL